MNKNKKNIIFLLITIASLILSSTITQATEINISGKYIVTANTAYKFNVTLNSNETKQFDLEKYDANYNASYWTNTTAGTLQPTFNETLNGTTNYYEITRNGDGIGTKWTYGLLNASNKSITDYTNGTTITFKTIHKRMSNDVTGWIFKYTIGNETIMSEGAGTRYVEYGYNWTIKINNVTQSINVYKDGVLTKTNLKTGSGHFTFLMNGTITQDPNDVNWIRIINMTINESNHTIRENTTTGNIYYANPNNYSYSGTAEMENMFPKEITVKNNKTIYFGDTYISTIHPTLGSIVLNSTCYMDDRTRSFNIQANQTQQLMSIQNISNKTIICENNPYYQATEATIPTTNLPQYYNVTLQSAQLILTFYQNGILRSTEGQIHDTSLINGTYGFNTTQQIVMQSDLEEGYIHAEFGMNNGTNWTQYYEYINDYQTTINESIEILQNSDWSAYLQVYDVAGNPLKDVVIRANYAYTEIGNWTSYKLLGQRLTDDDGKTFFIADQNTKIIFTIYKENYEPVQILISIGDTSYTTDNPLKVYMQYDTTGVSQQSWLYIRGWYNNRTQNITGTITAIDKDLVKITTDYRRGQALSYKTLTCDELGRCTILLEAGIDFATTGTDDIYMDVYLDNVLWRTIRIVYDAETRNEIFAWDTLEARYAKPILGIFILLATIITGLIFKNTEAGITGFFISSLIAGIISTTYLWLTIIVGLYFVVKIMKRIISE